MLEDNVAAIRHFSRFYTRRIGVLEDSLLGSGLTLPQGRLLFEIAQCAGGQATPGAMASVLALDAGYVSRLLGVIEGKGLVERQASASDGRSIALLLTPEGQRVFTEIDARSKVEIARLIGGLAGGAQRRIVDAMRTIEREFDSTRPRQDTAVLLRDPRPGDIGWVVHRHGVLYNLEYGWDWTFEALVAQVAGQYVESYDPDRDCCRIAAVEDRVVGSAFVVQGAAADIAKLRLVYVEPEMRGSGLGLRLVDACMAFARQAGYRRMALWTNDPLVAARRLYQRLGFEMTASEPVTAFGHDMVSETWERDL